MYTYACMQLCKQSTFRKATIFYTSRIHPGLRCSRWVFLLLSLLKAIPVLLDLRFSGLLLLRHQQLTIKMREWRETDANNFMKKSMLAPLSDRNYQNTAKDMLHW